MINTLLGIKKGMISSYDSRGRRVGATVLEIAPNQITQIKNAQTKDGYTAVQLGLGDRTRLTKPMAGHLKKAGISKNIRFLQEIRQTDDSTSENLTAGQELTVGQVFKKGDAVKVTGISKGRGFQGGVKRYNFKGGPKTHGQSDRHRAPGSIGAGTTPGRVYKGKRMAGHMGVTQTTYKGLEVVAVDRAKNLLTLKGGVPGHIGALVTVTNIGQIKGYTPPPEEKEDESEEENKVAESNSIPEGESEVVASNAISAESNEVESDSTKTEDSVNVETTPEPVAEEANNG